MSPVHFRSTRLVLSAMLLYPRSSMTKRAPIYNLPQKYLTDTLTLKAQIESSLYRPKAIHCNYQLSIIAVFVEYFRQFLIDLNQIYRHSSVPKTRLGEFMVNFLNFLAQAISVHDAAATFFVMLRLSRCSQSLDCLILA